ncbi:hypothetical protein N7491_008059 [Penicillium cf. griseofulvum]|uniref:Uncharacterized protein n=1 Tax=Penicillium cf. griseofulvum TaxID=2972120 RepID=A0A9W9J7V6_9EURO|nr:hypothetical protein N7472_008914 [Penicillium cf. griseofulvum]KAJ5427617.1 hypothetical protein N7491_008059 [Penicillium cf. griseofulvum]KAJ5431815.1 hypothetical protein N7445_008313 [Penicillium cf. griseofulvum]
MPSATNKGGSSTQLHLAMERLLMELKVSLQTLFDEPQGKRFELMAQSSHALSSTGAIWHRKPEYHNSSYLGFQYTKRRMMMMPTVFNNGLLIMPTHDKPGYAWVIGARFNHRSIEVTFTEAERLKDKDIRSMFKL